MPHGMSDRAGQPGNLSLARAVPPPPAVEARLEMGEVRCKGADGKRKEEKH